MFLFIDPDGNGFSMTNKDFSNFFGASIAGYNNKIISCAYREQWDTPYEKYRSNMGEHFNVLILFE